MIPPASYDFCSEAYVVEKTVEVVTEIGGEPATVRIDVLHNLRGGHYCTRAYIKEVVTLEPTYPQTREKHGALPREFEIWTDYDLPWTHHDTADDALSQALDFLRSGQLNR